MSNREPMEKIAFYEKDKRKADLKIKLHGDGLSQAGFFRGVVEAYTANNALFMEWLREFRSANSSIRSSTKTRKTEKLEKLGQENLRKFGITTEDLDDIFDLIEKEYPEL